MESNTFSTSVLIAAPAKTAYDYLCRLKNLDEWTLGSRMKEEVDPDTWIGTASGYQRTLYYHVRRLENNRFYGIEWQCGYEYENYFKCYPVLLFPPDYVEPGSTESGVYLHWVSVIDHVQRTQTTGHARAHQRRAPGLLSRGMPSRNRRRYLAPIARLSAGPGGSAGVPRSPNSSPRGPSMPPGSTRSPTRCGTTPPARHCKRSSTSISTS